jgi:hypothetical protein
MDAENDEQWDTRDNQATP